MNTQQNQNDIKKKDVQINPSRDVKYDEKEKDFSGEFGEQIDEGAGEEINPSELDNSEIELDRGGVEFGGGQEEGEPAQPGKPGQPDQSAFDQAVKNAGSRGSAQGYEGNTPDVGMSGDLGGDISKVSGVTKKKDQGNPLRQ